MKLEVCLQHHKVKTRCSWILQMGMCLLRERFSNIQLQGEVSENQSGLFAESLKNVFLYLFSSRHLQRVVHTDVSLRKHTGNLTYCAPRRGQDRFLSAWTDVLVCFPNTGATQTSFPDFPVSSSTASPLPPSPNRQVPHFLECNASGQKEDIYSVHYLGAFLPQENGFKS